VIFQVRKTGILDLCCAFLCRHNKVVTLRLYETLHYFILVTDSQSKNRDAASLNHVSSRSWCNVSAFLCFCRLC